MRQIRTILFLFALVLTCICHAQTKVYYTKTGEKYHQEHCQYLRHSKYETTLEKAVDFGYKPCLVCKPPRMASNSTSNQAVKSDEKETAPVQTNSSSRRTTAVQCSGRTQAGKRCKRRTKNASGRCYQH